MKYKLSNIKYQISILIAAMFFASPLKAQVMVGNLKSPNSFSLLEMDITYQKGGLRLPQLTTEGRNNLNINASDLTANGLVIYNLDTQCIEFWNDGGWVSMCSSSAKIVLDDLSRGGLGIDVTENPFPASSNSLSLIPHDTPECSDTNPYTASILSGGSYAHTVSVDASTGSFDLTMDANPSTDERMAILRVTDNCTGNYRDFLLVQDGCSILAKPGVISGPKYASTDGIGVTYSIVAVTGASSYTWILPNGWMGSSSDASIFAKPGALAQDGTISVMASNDCGSSAASTMDVKVVHGCGALIAPDTWKEFMCWNLGANYTSDPFTPSADLNGDYYQWGSKTPAATRDYIVGSWSSTVLATVYGDGTTTPSTTKSDNDPCPPGYRVPNKDEWVGVLNITYTNLNSRTNKPEGAAWVPGDTNWVGSMFGDALFLPATGWRSNNDIGDLNDRGYTGNYWTSTMVNTVSDISSNVYFSRNSTYLTGTQRAMGCSIRCIKQ